MMKTSTQTHCLTFKILLFGLLFTGLFSCEKKQYVKEFNIPEMAIQIKGNKPSSLDPYTINLAVTNAQSKKTVNLDIEIYANDLNDTNPVFSVNKDGKHSLVFTQTDNTTRELVFSINDEDVVIEEVL